MAGLSVFGSQWLLVNLGVWGCLMLYLMVGALRTANHMMKSGSGPQAVWVIYCGVPVLLLLTAMRVISLILPESDVLLPIDTRLPKVVVLNGQIEITGAIDYRTFTELDAVLKQDPRPSTILLNSDGGNVIAGRSIGLLIERSGLDTLVEINCFSACTLAFAGGHNRRLLDAGRLGFHGYQFDHGDRVQTLEVSEIEAKDRVYLQRRGVSVEFLDRVYQTEPEDIWIPSRVELIAAGVITE